MRNYLNNTYLLLSLDKPNSRRRNLQAIKYLVDRFKFRQQDGRVKAWLLTLLIINSIALTVSR